MPGSAGLSASQLARRTATRAYLEDVLQRVSVHPSSRVEEPAPRRWKDLFAGDPMVSNLGTGVECRASDLPGAS